VCESMHVRVYARPSQNVKEGERENGKVAEVEGGRHKENKRRARGTERGARRDIENVCVRVCGCRDGASRRESTFTVGVSVCERVGIGS